MAFVTFFAEFIGVKTGLLFGDYEYGYVLGLKLFKVPLLIGFLWLTLSLGAKSIAQRFTSLPSQIAYILAALLMVFVDFLIEPVLKFIGIEEYVSSRLEVVNGKTTGKLAGEPATNRCELHRAISYFLIRHTRFFFTNLSFKANRHLISNILFYFVSIFFITHPEYHWPKHVCFAASRLNQ